MSNNFLLRQFLKVGGSFFVGALVTYFDYVVKQVVLIFELGLRLLDSIRYTHSIVFCPPATKTPFF